VHISARKKSQQWPAANFAALIRAIAARRKMRFLLLWAPATRTMPGTRETTTRPGGRSGLQRASRAVLPTATLPGLIAALSLCDFVVCADGGAMHLAAGLGKRIMCFFGDSGPQRWRPWNIPHELLQPQSRDLKDLSVEQALAGFERLEKIPPLAS